MKVGKRGCFFSMVALGALLLFASWLVGAFSLEPMYCSSTAPVCERWSRQLNLSLGSSCVGIACLVLAGFNLRTGLFLALGVGVLTLTAIIGMLNPGQFLVSAVDLLLVGGVSVWLLSGWLDESR